jgi:AcrR family transcriptional regulator
MEDIGALVGMNKVSIYYYFESKEALFKAALKREADAYLERMEREVLGVAGCRRRIDSWIGLSFKYGSGSDLLRQVSLDTLKALSPLLDDFRKWSAATSEDFIARLIEEGREAGELRRVDSRRVAASIAMLVSASRDRANRRFMASPSGDADTAGTVEDLRYAIGLILDGIEETRGKGGKR